ncbi:uncharacterized protein LOC100204765 [Hydra vulgaris]|uniref:uncharacterized protein LOC100204765 n=1 Tax=Hydra vulgaris TaxID=6087 RepID=UPI0001925A44|nr:uncharacterized protein LOC100204765 isoform X1 [Hydra vulgaris]
MKIDIMNETNLEPVNKKKRFTMMRTDEEIHYINGNSDSDNYKANFDDHSGDANSNHNDDTPVVTHGDMDINNGDSCGLNFEDDMLPYTPEFKKKGQRGRPKKANESMEWNDEASEALIHLWQSKEELYNRQHPYFYVKEAKEKAIESIRLSLEKMGFKISASQIFSKFQSLRTYFCSQRTKIASARKNGVCDEEYLESKWRFYKSLQFLDDNMKQRETYATRPKFSDSSYPYDGLGPNGTFSRSMVVNELFQDNGKYDYRDDKYDYQEEKELHRSGSSTPPTRSIIKIEPRTDYNDLVRDEDQSFGELIATMMRQIRCGQQKDLLKLEIQQLIIKAKYANTNDHRSDHSRD